MYNPIPKDAPEFFTNKARFVQEQYSAHKKGDLITSTCFYAFRIGRSERIWWVKDQYIDPVCRAFLLGAKTRKARLVIKGYVSASTYTKTSFMILTHIALWRKSRVRGYKTYNPITGEVGFYRLRTEVN